MTHLKKLQLFFFCIVIFISCTPNFTINKYKFEKCILKTDGFYYNESSINTNQEMYFFYKNGTIFIERVWPSVEDEMTRLIKIKVENNFNKIYKYQKSYWGYYRTFGDSLVIQKPEQQEGHPVITYTGKFLNDSSFYINSAIHESKKVFYFEKINYNYRKFEAKPDSTNKFVR